ncbi:transglutaminase-like cysteine peptidase [Sphingomonas sp. G124]|uniref:Transglutaminase-like cysteine peptidase n=1 Tax=Sphingomonas cremea TaxID=2904799 RepID=A0A9X1TX82_9SPHN|nr:transglutaminase-like cysteine peptidase [Sphingomonas cremea]MCF2514885.1 transglutaminase-like cysteine peptidase [Sphingomonas cremea]
MSLIRSWFGVAVAGACMAAAAPATAFGVEAAATPSKSDAYRPLILDRTAAPAKAVAHPLILSRPASPDVFGTVALNAGVTFYDARFRRVAATDARDPLVQQLAAGAASLDSLGKLRLVQQEINERVHWAHDLDNMGVADFWANAGETLRRGTGDSEDIAIAKMQVLKAAGFDPKDLYISIGRHSTRGAHILLLARTAAGWFALDDRDGVQTPAQNSRFTPIMTLGQGMSWIHGRRVGTRVASANTKPRAK